MRVLPMCCRQHIFSLLQVDQFRDASEDEFDDVDDIMSYDNGS